MKDVRNNGKAIETAISKVFKKLMLQSKCVIIRLHDTKSAAYYLPPSPGDFMGTAMGKPLLVECKSSDVRHSFSDCRVKDYVEDIQFGYQKLWLRQKSCSLFVFHSVVTGDCEFWNGKHVLQAYSNGTALQVRDRLAACPITPKLLTNTTDEVLELL